MVVGRKDARCTKKVREVEKGMPNAERSRVVLEMPRFRKTDSVDSEAFSHKKDSELSRIRQDWDRVAAISWVSRIRSGRVGKLSLSGKKQTSRGIFGTMIWRTDLMKILLRYVPVHAGSDGHVAMTTKK